MGASLCGTRNGYIRHMRHGETACAACKAANAADSRRRRERLARLDPGESQRRKLERRLKGRALAALRERHAGEYEELLEAERRVAELFGEEGVSF